MADITGKIYQMKNADRTENRFPRTVIEAVLGLSSYLQDQFSSLADIYMPIEGIYEALTGQEFVFRKSPNTIKAKSLTLDRILGRTLAWNQLAPKYQQATITNNGITWVMDGNGLVTGNGTATKVSFSDGGAISSVTCYASHVYYFGATGTTLSDNVIPQAFTPNGNKTLTIGVGNAPIDGNYFLRIRVSAGETLTNAIFFIYLVDLTLLYGTEIDGLTYEQILAKYEADFGTGYHDYSAGKLISNDAESIETVGFNLWDEETELGAISSGTGLNYPDDTRIRTKNYIKIFPNTAYFIMTGSYTGILGTIIYYNAKKNVIGSIAPGTVRTITTPAGAEYMRIAFYTDYGTTYNHDICINLSDTNFNGQYEPYRKSTLLLNLDDFWVKDGQGNQVHITGGLKSAGNVYDEIVGNKYVKRVGSVDLGTLVAGDWTMQSTGNFITNKFNSVMKGVSANTEKGNLLSNKLTNSAWNTAGVNSEMAVSLMSVFFVGASGVDSSPALVTFLQGVMLNYELATPIEYDLVEPLIYTMKAGTTEARISPNEDGLSAPFCCDMTYSANENNDAGNAQYAATAGRLLNSHKIWGQDFNGTGDITGELTGVTNLTASGIITGSRLVSTVATGTAPLTVASTTMVQNLVAEKASKLLTARTIWGRSFDGSGDISGAISNITTLSASGLATIAGGIALGTSTKAQAAKMVWDETNNAWHLQGNLYVDGFVTAGGINNQE